MADANKLLSEFRAERDTIASLGLLTSTFLRFDASVSDGGASYHTGGYNVHCLVVDNSDGQLLAMEQNRIHAQSDPLQHAEQRGIRAALSVLHAKRPRDSGQRVDHYYKNRLFMAPGTAPEDYLRRGCTLYNTFDPCGFCAVTLLVAYMKRIAFLFDDTKFEKVYNDMGTNYFKGRDSIKESAWLVAEADTPLGKGAALVRRLREKVKALQAPPPDGLKMELVTTLDACRAELEEATRLFVRIKPEHFSTFGADRDSNARTLADIRRQLHVD